MAYRRKRHKYDREPTHSLGKTLLCGLVCIALVLGLILVATSCQNDQQPNPQESTGTGDTTIPVETTETIPPETTLPTVPTEPYIVSTATVGATGDLLMHDAVITSAQNYAKINGKSGYDFSELFQYVGELYGSFDYMIANLEVTFGGKEAGSYKGYPIFNCPDELLDAIRGAGIDMLLTANNHSNDTQFHGIMRTQEKLVEYGFDYTGSRMSVDVPNYLVKEINGIKVGMVCYTYDTRSDTPGRISLNGNPLKKDAEPLMNTFDYTDPTEFYTEIEGVLEQMRADGAEATMVFVHWGYEYNLQPNKMQKEMAQKLCDMGVDVIVGGHPHVIQPFDTLTSENGHTTYCIYSVGNAISNQRRESLSSTKNKNYTEDGMVFSVKFQKWNDGRVEIAEIDIIPTWVERYNRSSGGRVYHVIPLVLGDDWASYKVSPESRLEESYERTMSLVGEGLNECREALGLDPVPLTID